MHAARTAATARARTAGSTVGTTAAHGAASRCNRRGRHANIAAGYGLEVGTAKRAWRPLPNLPRPLKGTSRARVAPSSQATGLAGRRLRLARRWPNVLAEADSARTHGPHLSAAAKRAPRSVMAVNPRGRADRRFEGAPRGARRRRRGDARRWRGAELPRRLAHRDARRPRSPLDEGAAARRWAQRRRGARARAVPGGAVPSEAGQRPGGAHDGVERASATSPPRRDAVAPAWRAELRATSDAATRSRRRRRRPRRTARRRPPSLRASVPPNAGPTRRDGEASRRVMAARATADGQQAARAPPPRRHDAGHDPSRRRRASLRHEIGREADHRRREARRQGRRGRRRRRGGGEHSTPRRSSVDEKLLGWITAGANIESANAGLDEQAPRRCRAAAAGGVECHARRRRGARSGRSAGAEALAGACGAEALNPALKGVHAAVSAFQQVAREAASGDGAN